MGGGAEQQDDRGARRVGTEHLLLAVLHDPAAARPLGLDVETVRSALTALDEAALRAIVSRQ